MLPTRRGDTCGMGRRGRTRIADLLLPNQDQRESSTCANGRSCWSGPTSQATCVRSDPVTFCCFCYLGATSDGSALPLKGKERVSSARLPNPHLVEQGPPLLAELVVLHPFGDELDGERIREPHVWRLVDDRPVDLGPERTGRGRIDDLLLGRAVDQVIDLWVAEPRRRGKGGVAREPVGDEVRGGR